MKKLLTLATAIAWISGLQAQCPVYNIPGDLVQNSDIVMSGTFNIGGIFHVPSGVTVYVNAYGNDTCGMLVINARKIIIEGNIDGDFSGYTGGNPGLGATVVTSVTGDESALTGCHNKDNPGQITLGGGLPGGTGTGSGAGSSGGQGSVGSGPKQQCQNVGDAFGMIGGSGGAGGGGGGSYGGSGSAGGMGGGGSDQHTENNVSISSAYTVLGGIGGAGGNGGLVYGTSTGTDLEPGSGGGGAGGGGRSFYQGSNGNRGGNGGGAVKLVATDTLIVTGTIRVNGEDGQAGGTGGNGDETTDCCSDGCNDCGERTLSAGAGGGAGSGGGSGGGILLQSGYYARITGTLSANGGDGGGSGNKGTGLSCDYNGGIICGSQSITSGDGDNGQEGGAGGGGRIKLFVTDCPVNQVNPTHTETGGNSGAGNGASGTYNVITSACPDLAGLDEFNSSVFVLYPNPADAQVYISTSGIHTPAVIVITDALGRTVMTQPISADATPVLLNIQSLASGVYTAGLYAGSSVWFKKLIKP